MTDFLKWLEYVKNPENLASETSNAFLNQKPENQYYEDQHRFLNRNMIGLYLCGYAQFPQCFARHDPGSQLCQRSARCFGNKRSGSGCPRIYFQNIDNFALNGKLDVHQSYNIQFQGHEFCLTPDLVSDLYRNGVRGE